MKKSVRRDEVARLYGVSGAVKNILPQACKKQSMPYDKSRLAKKDIKQHELDVWAIARQRDLLVTFVDLDKSYPLSRAE